MMKLISWNVNGIRACSRNGFWDWFEAQNADVVCLQETKITKEDFTKIALERGLTELNPTLAAKKGGAKPTYVLAPAKRPGYSGVAMLFKTSPLSVQIGLDHEPYDSEGRLIMADFGRFTLVNVYVPNGGRELERIPFKIKFSDFLLKRLEGLRKRQKNIVICGDMNVAHTEIDIKNPKSNVNNSGFTPIEREWFTKFLSHKYVDTFRHLNPDARDIYTWWSYRPGVRQRNIGWRVDYFVVTQEMLNMVKNASVQMSQMGSDHCPVELILK